jgi:hypothetical protein
MEFGWADASMFCLPDTAMPVETAAGFASHVLQDLFIHHKGPLQAGFVNCTSG